LLKIETNGEKTMNAIIKKDHMLLALALVAAALVPDMALADPITTALCVVVTTITGGIGGAIATLAVIIIGIGALMGKVSWGMAIIVVLGIAIVFGAAELVGLLGGTGC
jgi:type IV secretion system protein VirB2